MMMTTKDMKSFHTSQPNGDDDDDKGDEKFSHITRKIVWVGEV